MSLTISLSATDVAVQMAGSTPDLNYEQFSAPTLEDVVYCHNTNTIGNCNNVSCSGDHCKNTPQIATCAGKGKLIFSAMKKPITNKKNDKCYAKCDSTAYCGTITSAGTCGMGKHAPAELLAHSSSENTSAPQAGSATCRVAYDFSDFSANDVSALAKWVQAVTTQQNALMTSPLTAAEAQHLRSSAVVTGVVTLWTQQITTAVGLIHDVDSINTYREDLLSNFSSEFALSAAFQQNLLLTMNLPSMPTTDRITFHLTHPQYLLFQASKVSKVSSQDLFMTAHANAIFQDQAGALSKAGEAQTIRSPVLKVVESRYLSGLDVQTYLFQDGIPVAAFTAANYPDVFATTYEVTCQVQQWSPMTAMFLMYNHTLTNALCAAILQDTGLLPNACFQNKGCPAVSADCKAAIQEHCTTVYSPPPSLTRLATDDFFMSTNSDSCYCYHTLVAPPDVASGNMTAMCFANSCNNNVDLNLFGLTDAACQPHCLQMYKWLHGQDPPENQDEVNWVRYNALCTEDYQPYAKQTLNWKVLVAGISGGVLLATATQLRARRWWLTVLVGLVAVGVAVFLGFDLAGQSNCQAATKTAVCRAQITGIALPSNMCTYQQSCECGMDADCARAGCTCSSGMCMSATHARKQTITKTVKVYFWALLLLLFCTISVPVTLSALKLKWPWVVVGGLVPAAVAAIFGWGTISQKGSESVCN